MAMLQSITNRMMTNADIQNRASAAVMPADETEYQQVCEAIAAQHKALSHIETELAGMDAEYEELTLNQALGQKVPAAELTRLEGSRDGLARKRRAALVAIDGLEARKAAWDAVATERARAAALAERQRLAGETGKRATALTKATRAFLAELEAYHGHIRAVDDADREWAHHSPNHGHGLARPRDPFVIPEAAFTPSRRGQVDVMAAFERWLEEPERQRQRAEREHAAYVRKAEEARTREERIRRIMEGPTWARPDGWQEETGYYAGYGPNGVPSRKGAA